MKKTKILIADEEPVNLDFFDVTLSKLGFDVYLASDGRQTLEMVKSVEPDLIILDNILPVLSGWKVTGLLKESEEYRKYRDIPVIMLSAIGNVRDKVEGFELGVEDYITEPFNFSEVLARIRAVLKNRELARQLVQKEKRLASVESLNDSFRYFTAHVRGPMEELYKSAVDLDLNDKDAVKILVERIRVDTEKALAALDGLHDEIEEIENNDGDFKTSLADLEEKFNKHFRVLEKDELEKEGTG